MAHYTEDDLILYHYGEAPWNKSRDRIDQHLQECEPCRSTYRDIARTLALVGDLDVPERDERYGLEVWQRIRHDLPPQEVPWLVGLMPWHRVALVGAAAALIVAAFIAGRFSSRATAAPQDALQAANLTEVRGELHEMRQLLTL